MKRHLPTLLWLSLSVLLHLLVLVLIWPMIQVNARPHKPDPATDEAPQAVAILDDAEGEEEILDPTALDAETELVPVPAVETPEEEEEEEPEGQIVELPAPRSDERPDEADYLAEHDHKVEQEMASNRFRVNPEVVASVYAEQDKWQVEKLPDVGATEPSTGATVGGSAAGDEPGGPGSAIPSPWTITNKEGLAAPVPASLADQELAGSPSNDMLREKRGPATMLNAKEYQFSGYINLLKRLVSFYWEQALHNMGPTRLTKPEYTTMVVAELNADGTLRDVEVVEESGSEPLDDCVIQAFKLAGPYPPPPEALVDPDGVARVPISFTVQIGSGKPQYQGVDPRANVEFPGILKAPR